MKKIREINKWDLVDGGNELLIYSTIYLEKIINKFYSINNDIFLNKYQMLNLNDELEKTYQQEKNSKRKKSLNFHFKLYKLAQLCVVKCDMRDFKISIKHEKTFNEYQTIWKKICVINKWDLVE